MTLIQDLEKYRLENNIRLGGGSVSLRVNNPTSWYPIYISKDVSSGKWEYNQGFPVKFFDMTNDEIESYIKKEIDDFKKEEEIELPAMETKEVLRKKMKTKMKSQKVSERRQRSGTIHKKLFIHEDFLKSKCVMLYVSKRTGEVETGPIIKQALIMGKKVVLPVTLVRDRDMILLIKIVTLWMISGTELTAPGLSQP